MPARPRRCSSAPPRGRRPPRPRASGWRRAGSRREPRGREEEAPDGRRGGVRPWEGQQLGGGGARRQRHFHPRAPPPDGLDREKPEKIDQRSQKRDAGGEEEGPRKMAGLLDGEPG